MTIRLRQICLLAAELEPVSASLLSQATIGHRLWHTHALADVMSVTIVRTLVE